MARKVATFLFKSGNTVEVQCVELTTLTDDAASRFCRYTLTYPKGYRGTKLHDVCLSEIEAVSVRPLTMWEWLTS